MPNLVILYGIPNCTTVKKARAWLEARGVAFAFHDFKKAGVSDPLIQQWLKDAPLDTLLNRRGTTWRNLSATSQAAAAAEAGAIALMIDQPSVIKRPILTIDQQVKAVGFTADQYAALFPS